MFQCRRWFAMGYAVYNFSCVNHVHIRSQVQNHPKKLSLLNCSFVKKWTGGVVHFHITALILSHSWLICYHYDLGMSVWKSEKFILSVDYENDWMCAWFELVTQFISIKITLIGILIRLRLVNLVHRLMPTLSTVLDS